MEQSERLFAMFSRVLVHHRAQKFFHPRCMDVVLAQGGFTYTGPPDVPPPDLHGAPYRAASTRLPNSNPATSKHVQEYDDVSDDEVSVGRSGTAGYAAYAAGQGDEFGRRRVRGRKKKGRMEFTRDLKASASEKWRVIVSYKPPVM